MIATRTYPLFMRMAAACSTACGVMAAEYHGTVTTSGVPVPGVSRRGARCAGCAGEFTGWGAYHRGTKCEIQGRAGKRQRSAWKVTAR
jgi:hypothetical protein